MKKIFKIVGITLLLMLFIFISIDAKLPVDGDYYVYFGSHGKGPGCGFSLAHFNSATGKLSTPVFFKEAVAPAFFIINKVGNRLYTCNSAPGSGVSAYSIDPATANLELLNEKPSCGGDPSYVSLDATEHFVMEANYDGKSIAVYALKTDGSIGKRTAFAEHSGTSINPERQSQPRPHCICADPSNNFVLVPDLGVDKLYVYRFDSKNGTLKPNEPTFASVLPGSGPRHVIFSADSRYAYLINEMGSSIIRFEWNSTKGTLKQFETYSTLPADFTGKSTCAEILVHPNGKFIYATNRGHNSVTVFSVDQKTGKLELLQHISTQGKTPRNCELDPTGKWLLVSNQDSNNAVVFSINPQKGILTQTGEPVSVTSPFCERFLKIK